MVGIKMYIDASHDKHEKIPFSIIHTTVLKFIVINNPVIYSFAGYPVYIYL
jgi:hypothetical protein